MTALLDAYAAEHRLYGHGLRYSPCSARFDDDSRGWLARLAADVARHRYRHVTEHWGWSRTRGLARGAPLPLPASEAVIAGTTRALRAMAEVAGVPVGLENLALALSDDDVDAQPAMLARVLDAIDGVLLLDVHNLWCQAVNYARDPRELAARYPLARVRELHLAGGGWSESAYGAPFRRDTHDAVVPDEVIELVGWLIPRCPALEVVIVERLPHALGDEPAREAWRGEVRRIADVVRDAARVPLEAVAAVAAAPVEPAATLDELAAFQDATFVALCDAPDPVAVRDALLGHPRFADQVARWDLRALEVARALVARWSVRDSVP